MVNVFLILIILNSFWAGYNLEQKNYKWLFVSLAFIIIFLIRWLLELIGIQMIVIKGGG